jgi:hypothetical protein
MRTDVMETLLSQNIIAGNNYETSHPHQSMVYSPRDMPVLQR